jgi:hypothetical protein
MEHKLSYLDDKERLEVYNTIVNGCMHMWSKNKLQQDKFEKVLDTFSYLAEKDPLFLAHFTSYAIKKLDTKDMKVIATFANSLSDADGTPFSLGSEFCKPNWRTVSQAALNELDPRLVLRVLTVANMKIKFGSKPVATHYSKTLKTAVKKYLRYREANPKALEGIKKNGLTEVYRKLYLLARLPPSLEAASVLGWPQKKGYPGHGAHKVKTLFDFSGLSDIEIATKIRAEKLPALSALGALPDSLTPVVAAAILEQATGDQVVILTEMFQRQGLLQDKDVLKVYSRKIKTAKNALDRVERINTNMISEVETALKDTKSEVRKEQVGDLGRVFLHIDISGSMSDGIQVAVDKGAIIAESVKDPETNFHWGLFNTTGKVLPNPSKFTKDGFAQVLYGQHPNGGTNCLALYKEARRLGCDIDIYITDQEHTEGNLITMLNRFKTEGVPEPKQVVIINVGRCVAKTLKIGFEASGIPVVELDPKQLSESALVSQAIKTALRGATAILDEIMDTPLLTLPKWWESVSSGKK